MGMASRERSLEDDIVDADLALIPRRNSQEIALSWRALVERSLETGRRRDSRDGQGSVIVIGGAGGIGSAVVTTYLERRIDVAVVDKNASPKVTPPSDGGQLRNVVADVTEPGEIARVGAELAQLGWSFGHLVSLAGGALAVEFGSLTEIDASSIEQSVELNLTSHILLAREFLLLLRDTSAPGQRPDRSITLVSSINALRDYGLPAYSAAKAGMFGFVYAMAAELGREGIRINAVVPGTVVTPATKMHQPKDFEALRRGSALGRLTRPDDVAAAVYAVSHTLTAVTGQQLVVDCGQLVKAPDWRLPVDGNGEEAR
jgi:NAD(P)-dependent dehydrogenase (short-subunit alcohol dehydrogenase family)